MDTKTLRDIIAVELQKEGELLFREFIENLTPSEVKVLKALAKSSDRKPTDIAAQEFMDDSTVTSSLNTLMGRGMIRRRARGVYEFTDNMFAEWLRIADAL